MPIRDVVLAATIIGLLPVCFLRPWIGVLVWAWVGLMNPHKLTWGFAYAMPFAMMVAVATLAGTLLCPDPERRRIPWMRETWLLAALWLIYTVSTWFAWYPDEAWPEWTKVSKILLFTFLSLLYFQTRYRLRWLFVVAALSLGFYGLKGGIWALRTGGFNDVVGPEGSFIAGNTEIGLALNMILPFLLVLAREEPLRWMRRLMLTMFAVSIVAIIFTYSRGAILGLPIVLIMLFVRARRRLLGIVALVVLAIFVTQFPPEAWFSRMATIQEYESDTSAVGRLTAWRVAWGLALDYPLTGGGFWVLPHRPVFATYAPDYPTYHSAHSIYFAVLGDHGFPGLAVFGGLMLSCYLSLVHLRRSVKDPVGSAWLVKYCQMIEASLAAYAISGAFLTMAYFDLFYYLVSFVILLNAIARREGLLVDGVIAARPVAARRVAVKTAA